jgi:hypothetical protein
MAVTPCCRPRPSSSKRTRSSALETPVTTPIWPPTSDSYATMSPRRKVLLSTMRRRPPPPAVSTVPLAASAPQLCGHGHARARRLSPNMLLLHNICIKIFRKIITRFL